MNARALRTLPAALGLALAVVAGPASGDPSTVYVYDGAGNLTDAINTSSDPVNCGAVGDACSSSNITPECAAALCNGACSSGYADCNGDKRADGCEASLLTSTANCGQCGRACSTNHVAAVCVAAGCNGACSTGWGDCNGNKQLDGCEQSLRTVSNCGACGRRCSGAMPICDTTRGVCVAYLP